MSQNDLRQPRSDPIDNVTWEPATSLKPNWWNPNRVFKPELRLLEHSIIQTGWMQPVIVNLDRLIIDGWHRWRLAQDSKELQRRYGGLVPVVVLPLAEDEAMAMTVRINRAKGVHVAVEMHALVARLLQEFEWPREKVATEIGATLKEVDVLAQDGIFALKRTAEWSYSQAWYPAETGTKYAADAVQEEAIP